MKTVPLMLVLLTAGSPSGGEDPVLALLEQEGIPERRAAIEDMLRAEGRDACERLSSYSRAREARARENAVRTMSAAGCSSADDYRPYFSDGSAWVADALLDALTRHRIAEGVPYALARLSDSRRLVSGDGSWTLAQAAHRTLRGLTAQPIPSARPQGQGTASGGVEAAWRSWYAQHGEEPASDWMASGLKRMREALAGNSAVRRVAALETAALIGEPGRPLLVEALRRKASDLEAALTCTPDGPPRVQDQVPCIITVRNTAPRRMALAPGEIAVKVAPWEPPATAPRGAEPSRPRGKPQPDPKEKATTGPAPSSRPPGAEDGRSLGGKIVDLGPGESLRREVQVGPVTTAGRYEINVRLGDLWGSLDPGPYDAPPIEAALVLRFEQ